MAHDVLLFDRKIANLFLIAAPRSGSTQLSSWLETHRDISCCSIKEPNYFSCHEFTEDYVQRHHLNDVNPSEYAARRKTNRMQFAVFRRLEDYSYLFDGMQTRWRMDASTTYLHCPEAAASIKSAAPDAKVIILVRNPLARAKSHFLLQHRIGRTVPKVADQVKLEKSGLLDIPGHFLLRPSEVSDSVDRYTKTFGANALLIFAEDMFSNPEQQLRRVAAFLDIGWDFNISVRAENSTALPRFRRINSVMHETGALLVLRRLIPKPLKKKISNFYYKKTVGGSLLDAEDEKVLRDALEEQVKAYEALKAHAQ